MDHAVVSALLNNAAILLVLSVIFGSAYRMPFRDHRLKSVFCGLMIALICVAIMNVPFSLRTGILFDTLSILISVTALMFGPMQTWIVVAAAVAYRFGVGGIGMLQGLAVIVISALIGLAWRRFVYPRSAKWRWESMYLMSLLVHAAMVGSTLLLPYPQSMAMLRGIALPVLLVFPIATVLLCLLLLRQQATCTMHDQLVQANAQLIRTNQNYRLLFEEMTEAFALCETVASEPEKPADYRFLTVNPAFERLIGIKAADLLGRTVHDMMPADQSYWLDTFDRVTQTDEPVRLNHYAQSMDRYFEVSAYHTSPTQFACTFLDVTQRTRVQEETSRILARLQSLLDNSPSPIVILDEKGRIIEGSSVARRILGLQGEDVPEKQIGKIAPPEIIQKVLYVLAQASDASPQLESIDVFEYNGSRRYFESRLFPLHAPQHGEKLFGYLAIDVTDRIRVEEALKASGEKYSNYIENAPSAVFVLDENGHCLEANRAATVITGYPKEQILTMAIADITSQESLELALYSFEALKANGHMSLELPFRHDSGARRWWLVDAVKLSDACYLCFASDISEKKQAEATLLHLSYHDFLTGLYNRRFFEAEMKRVDTVNQLPLSVFIGDINGVKLVNDTFGHAEGDRLIVDCAKIISDCCRSGDTVARIGGDEFGILMPKTDTATAVGILGKIQAALNAFDERIPKAMFTHSVSLGFGIKKTASEDVVQILRIAEEYMYQRKLLEHRSSHSAIISSIKATMIEKNHETQEHAERLVGLSKAIAQQLNLPQADQDRLELLATLHDIGKVGISESILLKKGPLTSAEWVEMKRHPEIGYRIAISSPELIPVAESILCHHERWDGQGYPQGLSGEKIPLLSRILAVVDAYDAMTQNRPYREAISHKAAMTEIELNAGTQFDPTLARIFIDLKNTAALFATDVTPN